MPKKIRELMALLTKVGFANRGGKGCHRNFLHSKGIRVTISGNLGDDARRYQEREVERRVKESQQ
jgi:predicted RNA binding protein YcfA (HicA-like mRNA interferase family)